MNAAQAFANLDPRGFVERRGRPRETVARRGAIMRADSAFNRPCLIRDVSQGGARIELGPGWTPEARLVLVDLARCLGFEGRMVWRRDRLCGLKLGPAYDLRGLTPPGLFWARSVFVPTGEPAPARGFGRLAGV